MEKALFSFSLTNQKTFFFFSFPTIRNYKVSSPKFVIQILLEIFQPPFQEFDFFFFFNHLSQANVRAVVFQF